MDNLRRLREAHGFNQDDVARVLGIDRSSYSYYESGKSEPKITNLIKLSRIFGVTVDALLYSPEQSDIVSVGSPYKGDEFYASYGKPQEDSAMKVGSCSQDEKILLMLFRMIDDKSSILNYVEEFYQKQEEENK